MLTAKDIYKDRIKGKYDISLTEFSKMLSDFNKYIVERLLNGDEIRLPSRMGVMAILGKKPKVNIVDGRLRGLAPDWKATNEYRAKNPGTKKIIYHTNSDSNGIIYSVKWNKFNVAAKNKRKYYFRPTRELKRTISALIKNGKEYRIIC